MDEFLRIIKDEKISSTEAMDEIVVKLMQKNLRNTDKTDGYLDAYDSETMQKGRLYNGNIYIFEYAANKPFKYTYNGKDIYYADDMPVFLLLEENEACIKGINLNFCNKGLCALILNLIQNLDTDFYNGGDVECYNSGKEVISKKVLSVLNTPDASKQLYIWLKKIYDGADYTVIFRTYSKKNIKNFRMIEPWQWKFIPSLTYHGSDKEDTMKAIQKIAGIDKIVI